MATKYPDPETMGHKSAWNRAYRATRELGFLVDVLTPLLPSVEAAKERVLHPKPTANWDAEKKAKRRSRG